MSDNTIARLKALHDQLVLDTSPDTRYNKIVAFAAAEFTVPMALISLVDNGRQWFKVGVGMEDGETAHDIPFCGHVLLTPNAMVVPDALEDDRFKGHPLVLGAPHIRFYAGARLQLPGGETIGTLCVMDRQPRKFQPAQLLALEDLRSLVVKQLTNVAVIL